jgi:hypothetical protein
MGAHVREDHEKFHAIAAPLPALYEAIERAVAKGSGPIEIDIEIRGAVKTGFSASVENPEELLELLRLATGR